MGTALRDLDEQGAEPIGEGHIRTEPNLILGGERREVDRVPDRAVPQEIADAHRGLDADELLCLDGGRGDVRGRDHLRQADQRLIGRRFDGEDVEARAGDMSALDRVGERRLIDQLSRAPC